MADRFASISSLLPARPPAQPAGDDAKPKSRPADGGEAASTSGAVRPVPVRSRPARRRRADESRPRASDEADGGTRRTAFRLDPDLHQQLSERAIREKTSKGNIVLDAIESAYAAGALEYAQAKPSKTGMFTRTADPTTAAPTVLVEIRLTSQALGQIDQLVDTTRQPTRTSLLHAALAHHFKGADMDD